MAEKEFLLIGLCGYARCGKDTACEYFSKKYSEVKFYAFADSLRNFAEQLNIYFPDVGLTYNQIIEKYGYEKAKDEIPSFRDHLVRIGNGARKTICDDIWIRSVIERINSDNPKIAIIKDVRYLNEAKMISRNKGIILYIERKRNEPANVVEEESIKQIKKYFQNKSSFFIVQNDGKNKDNFFSEIEKSCYLK